MTATILPGDPDLWSCILLYAAVSARLLSLIAAIYKWKDTLLMVSEILVSHGREDTVELSTHMGKQVPYLWDGATHL